MKVVKIIFGVLFALYSFAQIFGVLGRLFLTKVEGAYAIGQLSGGIAGICIGAAISVALFRSAFKKKNGS